MTTLDQAYEMGAKGAEPTETERLLFEAWMKGHCWMVHGDWDGKTYVHDSERSGYLHPGAMLSRQLWAAWRDRAALAEQPAPVQEPVGVVSIESDATYGCRVTALELTKKIPFGRHSLYTTPFAAQPAVPLTDEQIDAAIKAWFETDIVAGRQPFSKRMRAAFAAAHGIKEQE